MSEVAATTTPTTTPAPTPETKTEAVTTPAVVAPETAPAPAETKPADPSPAPEAAPAEVIPEKYELKLPDGAVLDPSHVEQVAAYAKEHKLTQKEAEAVLLRDSNLVSEFTQRKTEEYKKTVESWAEAAQADKEIGGDKFKQTVELSHRVIQKINPALLPELDATGFGNHPEVIRFFSRIAPLFNDDTIINPGGSSGAVEQELTLAGALYGTGKTA